MKLFHCVLNLRKLYLSCLSIGIFVNLIHQFTSYFVFRIENGNQFCLFYYFSFFVHQKKCGNLGHSKLTFWFSCHCSCKPTREKGISFYPFVAPKLMRMFFYIVNRQRKWWMRCLFTFFTDIAIKIRNEAASNDLREGLEILEINFEWPYQILVIFCHNFTFVESPFIIQFIKLSF